MKKLSLKYRAIYMIFIIVQFVLGTISFSYSMDKNRINKISEYKPLEIYGEKIFTIDDVDIKGNFSRFATENYDAIPGFKYSSQLRLTLDGNIARNISIKAQIDDSNLDKEEKEITLKINGNNFLATLGDFQSSFKGTEFTLYNKKLKGIELYTWLPNVGEATIIASRSEGKSSSEVFTGGGMQAEYMCKYSPVVKGSEKIKLDGKLLRRGTDYTIDYEDGSFALSQKLLPLEDRSRIDVEYEYYPEGSMYRRTLLGVRAKGYFSPENYFGVTLLSDCDEKGNPEGKDDPNNGPPPSGKRVAGVDFSFNGKNNSKLSGEYALSSIDPNLLTKKSSEGIRSGHAGKIGFSMKSQSFDLDIKRVEMDPKFDSIGKTRLVRDRELTSVGIKYIPVKALELNISGDAGRSYNSGDPDIPSSASRLVRISKRNLNGTVTYRLNKKNSIDFSSMRRIKKNRNEKIHFDERINGTSIHTQFKGYKEKIRYNIRKVFNDYRTDNNKYERLVEAGLSGKIYKKTTLSMNGSRVYYDKGESSKREREVLNLSMNLTSNPSRTFFTSAAISQRIEEKFLEGKKDTMLSGDIKMRYNPIDTLQIQGRFKEIHTKKFVVNYHDNLEKLLESKNYEKDTVIRVNEPVATATGSLMFNYFPSNRSSAIAQYQFKKITNMETKEDLSVSDSAMFELKMSPRRKITTILRSMISRNKQNSGNKYETSSDNHEFEVRKSINKSLTGIGNIGFNRIRDSYNKLLEEDKLSGKLKLEKNISKSLFINGGISRGEVKKFSPTRNNIETSYLAGVRYTPVNSNLTVRSNIVHSEENDLGVKDRKTVIDTLINFNIDEDTFVESNYKFVRQSDNKFEKGYDSRIGKITVTKRF